MTLTGGTIYWQTSDGKWEPFGEMGSVELTLEPAKRERIEPIITADNVVEVSIELEATDALYEWIADGILNAEIDGMEAALERSLSE